jgi:hypothetical protein
MSAKISYNRTRVEKCAQFVKNNNPSPRMYNRTVSEIVKMMEEMMWKMTEDKSYWTGTAGFMIVNEDHDEETDTYSFNVYVDAGPGSENDEYVDVSRA